MKAKIEKLYKEVRGKLCAEDKAWIPVARALKQAADCCLEEPKKAPTKKMPPPEKVADTDPEQ